MESLESILGCNWSKMEEIASWTEEDGRGGSSFFFCRWDPIQRFEGLVRPVRDPRERLKLFLIISVII